MESYGVFDNELSYLKIYMGHHYQFVNIDDISSTYR